MKYKNAVLLGAVVTAGLMAGLFFTFSVAINPAFRQLSDAEYITAMNAINKAIENPVFFLGYFGALVLLPLAAYQHRGKPASRNFKLLAISALLYVIGTFGVTSAFNLPLNYRMEKVNVAASSPAELAKIRRDYIGPWNNWHAVRTAASITALVFVAAACILPDTTNTKSAKNS